MFSQLIPISLVLETVIIFILISSVMCIRTCACRACPPPACSCRSDLMQDDVVRKRVRRNLRLQDKHSLWLTNCVTAPPIEHVSCPVTVFMC